MRATFTVTLTAARGSDGICGLRWLLKGAWRDHRLRALDSASFIQNFAARCGKRRDAPGA
jgi:hypothetical protein